MSASIIIAIVSVGIASLSTIIGGCALSLTIWQGKQNDKHNRLSVRPELTIARYISTRGTQIYANVRLINGGFGPALITSVVLFSDDIKVSQTYYDFAEEKLKEFTKKRFSPLAPRVVIRAGEEYLMASVEYEGDESRLDFIDRLDIEIKYQSIYRDETFTYDSKIDRRLAE